MLDGNLVIGVEDEAVLRPEVACNLELGLDVVLHLVVVTVEMVRGYIRYDSDIGAEFVSIIELETADYQHIVVVLLGSDLHCVALADVAAESYVEAGFGQQVVYQRGRRGLAVRSGDADLLCTVEARGEFYFAHDVGALVGELAHYRCR